jgi:hypothetical protein
MQPTLGQLLAMQEEHFKDVLLWNFGGPSYHSLSLHHFLALDERESSTGFNHLRGGDAKDAPTRPQLIEALENLGRIYTCISGIKWNDAIEVIVTAVKMGVNCHKTSCDHPQVLRYLLEIGLHTFGTEVKEKRTDNPRGSHPVNFYKDMFERIMLSALTNSPNLSSWYAFKEQMYNQIKWNKRNLKLNNTVTSYSPETRVKTTSPPKSISTSATQSIKGEKPARKICAPSVLGALGMTKRDKITKASLPWSCSLKDVDHHKQFIHLETRDEIKTFGGMKVANLMEQSNFGMSTSTKAEAIDILKKLD